MKIRQSWKTKTKTRNPSSNLYVFLFSFFLSPNFLIMWNSMCYTFKTLEYSTHTVNCAVWLQVAAVSHSHNWWLCECRLCDCRLQLSHTVTIVDCVSACVWVSLFTIFCQGHVWKEFETQALSSAGSEPNAPGSSEKRRFYR